MLAAVADEGEADPADVAAALRAVLAQMDDAASDLTATPAMRHRIEGAALAFEALSTAWSDVSGRSDS